ncbi:MAG TPA: hypothetical protein VIL49_13685 [Capillimicrobium sp.]
MITVETPFRDFLAFWAEAAGRPRDEQERLWHERYTDRHPALFALHRRVFGDVDAGLAEALPRFDEVAAQAEARFASLDLLGQAQRVERIMGLPAEGRMVAFVGTFGPMAWLDPFEGGFAGFFALEKHVDLEANSLYAAHELAHLVHFSHRAGDWPDLCAGQELVSEGIAMHVMRRIAPGVSGEQRYLVPDFAAYAAAVEEALPWAVPQLLACFDEADPEQTKRLFWPDWARDRRDIPESFGYLVGERVVTRLLADHPLAEIACWSSERARAEARAVLERGELAEL